MQPSPTALSSRQRLLGRNATVAAAPAPRPLGQGTRAAQLPARAAASWKGSARGRVLLGDCGHRSEASPGLSILLHEHGGFCSQASVRKEKTYAHPVDATVQHPAGSASTSAPPKGRPALPPTRSRSLRVFFADILGLWIPLGPSPLLHLPALPSHPGHPWTPGFDTENKLHKEVPGGPVVSTPLQGVGV